MAADLAFHQHLEEQQELLDDLSAQQVSALETGLVTDPKSDPHGGFRVACTWPDAVTRPASRLSEQIAALVPGTPPYGYDSIQSSLGNALAPGRRLVDPTGIAEDKATLEALCTGVESALASLESSPSWRLRFGPALVAPRMAIVFGHAEPGFWQLQHAVLGACMKAADGIELEPSWGPHLTLTRFGRPATPAVAASMLSLLELWRPAEVQPAAIAVGYYTVGDGHFSVTTYRSFPFG
jgi:hypothetical protein